MRRQQQQKLNDVETINSVDDLDINDLKENKNLRIAADKIKNKYKKIRQKRKAPIPIETLHKESETYVPRSSKKKADKRVIIPAKNILKKYKYGRF